LNDDGTDDGGSNIINSDITTNTTWESGKTYVISGSIGVDGAILTIEPGVTVKFETGASLHIGYYNNATLIANGTTSKPIVFTSTAANPTAGAWEGITFWDNSLNSSMQYCKVQYAGKSNEGAVNVKTCAITFSNNEVTNAKYYGVMLNYEGSFTEMANNSFANCGDHPLRISAEYMHTIGVGNTFTCPDDKGISVFSGDATGNITWRKHSVPYFIDSDIDYDNGTLTIEPGAIFKFSAGGELHIGYYNNSTLVANGTSNDKIVFTSSAAVPAAGAWEGITFWDHSLNSSMHYCDILYAGTSSEGAVNVKTCEITFQNNTIDYAKTYGILVNSEGSFTSITNNTFSNCGDHPLRMSVKYMYTIGIGNVFNCPDNMGVNVYSGTATGTITWRKLDKPYYIDE
ncbi:MAG: right-handed parallel beta-helix repeat-containing protein, partial [Bacteroidales bacterium]|nr:right-handed parallel beta-helix repeat-containing protein [Bacteroidales bacterium]